MHNCWIANNNNQIDPIVVGHGYNRVKRMAKVMLCNKCNQEFPSRNKLFQHLKVCLLVREQPNESCETYEIAKNQYLYVTAGRIRGRTLGYVERYSFSDNKWERCANVIENRGSHGAVSVDNTLYIIGGGGFRSNLTSVEKYNPESNTWTTLTNMPTPRHALTTVSVENTILNSPLIGDATTDSYIFAIGGWINGTISSNHCEFYSVKEDKWYVASCLPTGRRLLSATYYKSKIYTFGGNLGDKVWNSAAVEIYDIPTDSWTTATDLPIKGQTSAVTIGDYIYVVLHGHYILRYHPETLHYEQISYQLPRERWYCFDCVVHAGRYLYLIGGKIDGIWSTECWRYDISTNIWSQCPSMKYARRRCAAAVVSHDRYDHPETSYPQLEDEHDGKDQECGKKRTRMPEDNTSNNSV